MDESNEKKNQPSGGGKLAIHRAKLDGDAQAALTGPPKRVRLWAARGREHITLHHTILSGDIVAY